ncbi:MAG: cysteine--tRNA ligase [Candidatus Chisholmbacteria bacterium RIFCSPLOWO2_01_FULL_50_28]|uniref:Cysteine--tRNA ligase n=1 Tax=Candidatus Chisholmbacteria bacterium RIFCSPHIGHO2_01_FULL_52_32 TaxID=1797591 RepID=A0A1G1VS85_9BACT|nr:MAG: cysteine--tRNA ligase [Candidatus Chisholmbacteria bacterium RIFCSPHIGHO2_01_FULL_52_32]OGY20366.1 MAG: cysteine--tRNA ligase [Candidatus Chisholmbacteria bacterium RIFCSPLOWO2_01_FULL_50_28]
MRIYNTLSRKIEEFAPINPPAVGMYTCGMTVYDFAHIGHGRKYVGDDILRRTLAYLGYTVTHVQNVTDVGHLSSDADSGEDKLEKGAKKTGKNVWEVAEEFTTHFYKSMDALNVLRPDIICKATDHIKEQVDLVGRLVAKGFAYDTSEAVYFDILKFPSYARLFGQKLEEKKTAARSEVKTGVHKKHPADFALWFKRVGRFADHSMHWESPWGDGFPGWHIECSAMSMKYLGDSFDIHTGGTDHISIHHPNEIAQSEAATGKPFVRYWVHHAFLIVDGKKMSKSLGNIYTITDVKAKGFDPLALRYLYLTTHYRKLLNFTWEGLEAAAKGLERLREVMAQFREARERTMLSADKLAKVDLLRKKFTEAISDDLSMPEALSVVWEVVKTNIPGYDKYDLLLDLDQVLGLNLASSVQHSASSVVIPEDVVNLVNRREELRRVKKFAQADEVRKAIEKKGFAVEDRPEGARIKQLKITF